MKQVTASELKNNIGKYLDLLLLEKQLEITRHGRVIAKLTAVSDIPQANNKKEGE